MNATKQTPDERFITVAEFDELKAQLAETQNLLAIETSVADAHVKASAELEAELDAANKSIGEWGGKYARAVFEIDALKAQLAEASKPVRHYLIEIDYLRGQLRHDQKQCAEAEARAGRYEQALMKETDDLIAATRRAITAEAEASRLRAAVVAVEWSENGQCLWCTWHISRGHCADCQRQAALKEGE